MKEYLYSSHQIRKLGHYYARSTKARFLWWRFILAKINPLQFKNIWQDLLMSWWISQGIVISHQVYTLSLVAFLCYAPACSFLKCTIRHKGYWSCERCLVKGSWSGRVIFNGKEQHSLRTDNDFAQMLYQNHQKGLSALLHLKVRCVSMFPLDYMHLVCLGSVRGIIQFWKKGPHCRMSQLFQISDKLIESRECIPSDFVRKRRSLRQLDYWKAMEFWQFLLYTDTVALYDILPTPMYQHLLCITYMVYYIWVKM